MADPSSPTNTSPQVLRTPPPHPFLTVPKLYISNLSPDVTDADLARAFESCTPVRPNIARTSAIGPLRGEIDFKFLESAEKALATLQSRQLQPPSPKAVLVLSPFPPTEPPTLLPPPQALPRLVKHLPPAITDSYLFDLFRPYGALHSVRNQASFGPDVGIVEFWNEEDAKRAEEELHCSDVGGNNIAVQVYQQRRGGHVDFNAAAPPFVPQGGMPPYSPSSPSSRLPYGSNYSPPYPGGSPGSGKGGHSLFVHGPGQQVQFAPLIGPGSGSHSGLIDPCNLFCKNLDPAIDSNDLFTYFRPFGQIVSARVMRGDNGQSRGFGFVSYQTPDQAQHAMHAMNGQLLGSKQVQVRLHEPKQLRQEKLAQRFAQGGPHSRGSPSGTSSPALSEGAESPGPERIRRGSGSYYNAALAGNLNLTWELDEMQSLSPVVRREVLTGELNRRVKGLETVPTADIDRVVDSLLSLSLAEVVQGIQDPTTFATQVKTATEQVAAKDRLPSEPLLEPSSLELLTASPPRITSPALPISPSGSVTPASERDRLLAAVSRVEPDASKAAAIGELLLTLSKKERALCLFNAEYLKTKVNEAREVLDADDAEDLRTSSAPPAPGRPSPSPVESEIKSSSAPPLSPSPPEPPMHVAPTIESETKEKESPRAAEIKSAVKHTLSSLARLPAKEIIQLVDADAVPDLQLPRADLLIVKATDEFVDSLDGKLVQQQKQLVGEKLFRIIKNFGIKGAPKITIALLDSEDLRALSHLMNSYSVVLKEKVLQLHAK